MVLPVIELKWNESQCVIMSRIPISKGSRPPSSGFRQWFSSAHMFLVSDAVSRVVFGAIQKERQHPARMHIHSSLVRLLRRLWSFKSGQQAVLSFTPAPNLHTKLRHSEPGQVMSRSSQSTSGVLLVALKACLHLSDGGHITYLKFTVPGYT